MSEHDKMNESGTIPAKHTSQWRKNERLIYQDPALRKARDIAEGLRSHDGIVSAGFGDGYDQIDWTKRDDTPRSYRLKVNGRYVDDDDT